MRGRIVSIKHARTTKGTTNMQIDWYAIALNAPKRRTHLAPLYGIDAPVRDLRTASMQIAIARKTEAAAIERAKAQDTCAF